MFWPLRGIIECMYRVFIMGFLVSVLSASAMPYASASTWPGAEETVNASPTDTEPLAELTAPQPARLQSLLIHAISLIGVKYKFGGSSAESGFDCSGFVRHVFAESMALDLPRNSYAIAQLGTSVNRDDLQPGDLVFYNTRRRAFSHVGIYLGEGRFVHAPSRGKSVEIVDSADQYWRKRFNGARRVAIE